MPDPVVDFPYDPKDQDKVTRDVQRGIATGGPTTPQPPTDPMDTGGLDRRDPTSFAPPKEELEPAWITRKRDMDRRKVLRQAQRQLKQR